MKIAFATQDSVHINAHFGWASKIDVYDADTNGYTFLETLEFQGNLQEDGNEDKLEPKLRALQGCTIVYVSAIGGSAAARLIHKNITPIKAESEADEIEEVLTRFVKTLNGNPPPWLRKALLKNQPRNFEDSFESIEEEITV
ncbi:MAG: nitrogen fixation protein NifX [Cyanobacteria bacterium SID2]|nr:nitrogen fixation protein NifX [Cyanobacteria bacterium SID2]MBP0002567.1 nitrogen fixation protein NifX [Cyanobacteria bacterium SBC]